jgi:hypothetical protein
VTLERLRGGCNAAARYAGITPQLIHTMREPSTTQTSSRMCVCVRARARALMRLICTVRAFHNVVFVAQQLSVEVLR